MLLLSGALVALAACQAQGPDENFERYLRRLGTTLTVAQVPRIHTLLPRPPRTGKLRLDIPSGSLDTLDFLALGGCAVQVTIGKRNSSLGRLARPSQRLLLELEYLRLAPACIDALQRQGREQLATTLQNAWSDKREQLPALIFNATLGGEEYRAFWLASRAPGAYPIVTSAVSVHALQALDRQAQRWLAGDYQADNREFEILLSEVAGGDGGVLLRELARQQAWLAAADSMLQQRLAREPLCGPSTRHAAADILPNVIRRYFVNGLQVNAAALNRRFYELLPAVNTLEERLADILPAPYQRWVQERNLLFTEATGAPLRHVQVLQQIQQPCSALSPRHLPMAGTIG